MAFTRKTLKAMGYTDEQVDGLIELHTEVTDGLKAEINKYKADAEKLPTVQKELDDLKAKGDGGFKKKYDDEHAAFEKYKTEQSAKETAAAKEKAVRAYFEDKKITGKNLDLAIRAAKAEIDAAELDGDKIKDTKAFDDLVAGDLSGLVTTTRIRGVHTQTPSGNGGGATMTKADIAKIKDPAERRQAIADNLALFEKGTDD